MSQCIVKASSSSIFFLTKFIRKYQDLINKQCLWYDFLLDNYPSKLKWTQSQQKTHQWCPNNIFSESHVEEHWGPIIPKRFAKYSWGRKGTHTYLLIVFALLTIQPLVKWSHYYILLIYRYRKHKYSLCIFSRQIQLIWSHRSSPMISILKLYMYMLSSSIPTSPAYEVHVYI